MARVSYPEPGTVGAKARDVFARVPPLNVLQMLLHSEPTFLAFMKMSKTIAVDLQLEPELREMAILRVGALSNCAYEVHQHERLARQLGISETAIVASRTGGDSAGLSETQRLVLLFTDEVVLKGRASDETFRPLVAGLSIAAVQELLITIGFYMTVCSFLLTFDIEIEDVPPAGRIDQPRENA